MDDLKGATVWLTGLPCSGKSTIADMLRQLLTARGRRVEVLDGDLIRAELSPDLGFTPADRDANVRRIALLAHLLTRNGVITIVAAVSPYAKARRQARERISDFIEVYVDCPLVECERRDVKGLYARARAGHITGFTGVDDPYEVPERADLTVRTSEQSAEQCAQSVLAVLERSGYLER